MKLKKYVLLDDKRIVEISGKAKHGYEYIESKSENGLVITRTILEDRLVKTSDNILDLVEVGDLVETCKEGDETYGDLMFVHKIYDNSFYNKVNAYGYLKEDVIAIYKRQPNGDYKRYEVE